MPQLSVSEKLIKTEVKSPLCDSPWGKIVLYFPLDCLQYLTQGICKDTTTFSSWVSKKALTFFIVSHKNHKSLKVKRTSHVSSYLPKRMREIRFDKIGFNVLADTHDMCYALSLKNWQLDREKQDK